MEPLSSVPVEEAIALGSRPEMCRVWFMANSRLESLSCHSQVPESPSGRAFQNYIFCMCAKPPGPLYEDFQKQESRGPRALVTGLMLEERGRVVPQNNPLKMP